MEGNTRLSPAVGRFIVQEGAEPLPIFMCTPSHGQTPLSPSYGNTSPADDYLSPGDTMTQWV